MTSALSPPSLAFSLRLAELSATIEVGVYIAGARDFIMKYRLDADDGGGGGVNIIDTLLDWTILKSEQHNANTQ